MGSNALTPRPARPPIFFDRDSVLNEVIIRNGKPSAALWWVIVGVTLRLVEGLAAAPSRLGTAMMKRSLCIDRQACFTT